jgi:signal transduction histidine kinase
MHMNGSQKPFNLRKWFSFVSLAVTGAVAIVFGAALSHFFVNETIRRDANLTSQFIQSIAEIEALHAAFDHDRITLGQILDGRVDAAAMGAEAPALTRAKGEFFDHLSRMPEALLAVVFAPDGTVLWSTNHTLIGKRFANNHELNEVLATKKTVAGGHLRSTAGKKVEQQFLRDPQDIYIENYVPLFDRRGEVVSVVEIYKEPQDLIRAIKRGYVIIWLAALAAGAVVYFALRWIVIRAARQIDAQQIQLVNNERLVALGEMASVVAHGLRNPLASIRSSAELGLDIAEPPVIKNLSDIVTQVDRLSKWVRELLQFSLPPSEDREAIRLSAAVDESLAAFEVQMHRAGIVVDWQPQGSADVQVVANAPLLAQALNSVIANAVEAMPRGGKLRVWMAPPEDGQVELTIADSGCGMSPEQLALAFKPFHTTKRGGLGAGLALVKRVVERFGGEVALESTPRVGTTLHLKLRLA